LPTVAIKYKSCPFKVLSSLVQYLLIMKFSSQLCTVPFLPSLEAQIYILATASSSSNLLYSSFSLFLIFPSIFSIRNRAFSWPRENSLDSPGFKIHRFGGPFISLRRVGLSWAVEHDAVSCVWMCHNSRWRMLITVTSAWLDQKFIWHGPFALYRFSVLFSSFSYCLGLCPDCWRARPVWFLRTWRPSLKPWRRLYLVFSEIKCIF